MSCRPASPGAMNRLRGNGPSGFGGGRAWPVVVVPACLAVRRSYTPDEEHPVADQIHAGPRHALEVERETERPLGQGVVVDRHDRGRHLLPLLAREARAPLVQRPPAEPDPRQEPDERRDRRRLQDDRVAAGVDVARRSRGDRLVRGPLADGRGVELVPSGREHLREAAPAVRAGHDRRHGGLRRRRPAELALGVGDRDLARERLVRAGGREALRALRDELRDGLGAFGRAWSRPSPRRTRGARASAPAARAPGTAGRARRRSPSRARSRPPAARPRGRSRSTP